MKTRAFLGLNVEAPWPENWPQGRVITEENRHITLAFLGDISLEKLNLTTFCLPDFTSGFTGRFIAPLFLPRETPRLVAWQVDFFERMQTLQTYRKKLICWLKDQGFSPSEKNFFLSHMTICRDPENFEEWEKSFAVLPMYFSNICLYESLGHSKYKVVWKHALQRPFVERHHTADIAFFVYGETFSEIYQNARAALGFQFPSLMQQSFDHKENLTTLDDVIMQLNRLIAEVDAQEGIGLKAISFHGKIEKKQNLYQWEMIIDV